MDFDSGVADGADIQDKAADHDGRVVAIGQLILFSTETADAWLLEVTGQLAVRRARDGDPEPIHLKETDTSFAIEWKRHYRIEGPPSSSPIRHRPRHGHPWLPNTKDPSNGLDLKISNMFG